MMLPGNKHTENFFNHILESTPDPIIVVDNNGLIVLMNARAAELFGYTKSELLGQAVEVLVSESKRKQHIGLRQAFHAQPRTRAMSASSDLSVQRKDGSEFSAEISLSPMKTDDGMLVIASVRDITERKKTEAEQEKIALQMQHSQKLESLGVLAGGIAHDFNNLLTSILGNASLALKQLPPESPALSSLLEIEKTSERAADLVRQLLAYSGRGHFVIAPIDISRIVEEMAHLLETVISKKAVLRFDFFNDLPAINADVTQVRQIVMNLITNASDAIGEKSGVIALRTGVLHADQEYLQSTQLYEELAEGYYVYLEVSDTGKGMDENTKAKIFDPFFTTKFTGRGLGLAAVLGIMRGHNGAIKCYSEVKRGTTFKVLFPCFDLLGKMQEEPKIKKTDWKGSGTILIADDEMSVRALLRKILELQGFTVLDAEDGRQALKLFTQHAKDIKGVILDLTMPHLGGEETLSAIRRIQKDIPVILMSGYTVAEVTSLFSGKNVGGFIQKPFKADEMLEIVHNSFNLE